MRCTSPPLTLVWKPRQSDSRYQVEILNANDDPVFTLETHDTTLVVPPGTLAPGTSRWWVRSRATDGAGIRSRVENLTIRRASGGARMRNAVRVSAPASQ